MSLLKRNRPFLDQGVYLLVFGIRQGASVDIEQVHWRSESSNDVTGSETMKLRP